MAARLKQLPVDSIKRRTDEPAFSGEMIMEVILKLSKLGQKLPQHSKIFFTMYEHSDKNWEASMDAIKRIAESE